MNTRHKIIHSDSREMNFLDDNSINLIITSPPYWQLKDYGSDNQIGYHESYESYINNLNLVWNECNRVLESGCRLCVNIGDQFARSVYYGRYKVIPIRTEIIKFCESIGMDYMGAIIWQKVTTTNTTGGATIMGSFPYPRNGILKIDYEFILIFKKLGKAKRPTIENKELSKMSTEEWNTFFSGHWNFAGVKQEGHLAMFPEELPRRLIKMFTFYGDTVLDPFMGSGTTSLAARNLGRNSVGYEINADFIEVAKQKLDINQSDIAGTTYEFHQDDVKTDLYQKIRELPYIFVDTHKLDKKINPKKLQFGSKIDNNSSKREEYYTVKDVLTPELIRLSNDIVIRLLGIKTNKTSNEQAIKFILEKTKGKKVYLRFDSNKYDDQNNLLCYLYLQNKTFVNAHLIKRGFVDVDVNSEYKFKNKFISFGERIEQ